MRWLLPLAAGTLLSVQSTGLVIPDTWTDRAAPHRIIANVYYVGTVDLASYLITTRAGHILIDTGLDKNAAVVLNGIDQLGFEVRGVRLLLTTQAHFDHVGAHARVARETGARVVVSAEDAPVLEGGGKGDYHFGPRYYFPKVKVNQVIRDGQVITLGGTSLTAHVTPGHTKGTTTWTMLAPDRRGRLRHVVFMGSTTVNEGVRLIDNREYPQIVTDFKRSFGVLKELPCDVFLAAHASAFDGPAKAEAARTGSGEDAFIDPEGCRAAVERSEAAFERELLRQRQGGARK